MRETSRLRSSSRRFSRLLYRYSFRKVTVSNLNIPADEIPLFNQPTLVSEFSTTWFRDTRDNPADAHKGSFNSANFGVAGTAIGSSASFLSFFFQNSGFTPAEKELDVSRARFAWVFLRPTPPLFLLLFPRRQENPPAQVIPLPERLFVGGGSSLRGFRLEPSRAARFHHGISRRRPGNDHPEPGIALSAKASRSLEKGWAVHFSMMVGTCTAS